jgi:hypothetical protein
MSETLRWETLARIGLFWSCETLTKKLETEVQIQV